MNSQSHNTHATTNTVRSHNGTVDWTRFIATAMFEGGQTFLRTMSSASPDDDEVQLQADENQADQRFAQALANAKRARSNPGSQLLSAVRNWSRKQAIAILREKVAGNQVRQDFYHPFQFDLQQEISALILDLELFWEQEDEQKASAAMQQATVKRAEAEQAFGAAYPIVRGLNEVVLQNERHRQVIFTDGQKAAQAWASKYEGSVDARMRQLEEREKRIQQQERENREHQIALRSLAKWDDKTSFANTVVRTGKNTIGCLLIWFLLIGGALLAIYLAFPHH